MHHSIAGSPESNLLGKNIVQVPELVEEADPTTWVSSDDAPFFIHHGIEDNLVPYQVSVILALKLGKSLCSDIVHMELFPATGHGNWSAFYTKENIDKIFSFLDFYLKEKERGTIQINGFKMNYLVEGEGIPCLVIGSSVYYPKTFSNRHKKHLKMYFVDMPWFAAERGEMPAESFSVEKLNAFIEEIREQLELKKPVVIGHSIHGTVAMEYAKEYPDKVLALVMIGSPNIYGNETFTGIQSEAWGRASELRKRLQYENWARLAETKDQFSASELIVEEYCTMGPTYWSNPYYNARKLWDGMIIHADILHFLYVHVYHDYFMFKDRREAPVPTLVFLGKQDFATPPELWEKDKDVINLNIKVLNYSGHTPRVEESENFDMELLKWLNR